MEPVRPFYVVCDESYSMEPLLGALNDGLHELHAAVSADPAAADLARCGVIGFSDDAEVLLALADLSDVTQLRRLAAKGGTNYGAAFGLLRDTIEQDVANLEAEDCHVLRPAAFFLTDGQPNYDWRTELQRLTDPDWEHRPDLVAFGFGTADENTIAEIGTYRSFVADNTIGPAETVREFASALTEALLRSGDATILTVPDQVPGFTGLRTDEI